MLQGCRREHNNSAKEGRRLMVRGVLPAQDGRSHPDGYIVWAIFSEIAPQIGSECAIWINHSGFLLAWEAVTCLEIRR